MFFPRPLAVAHVEDAPIRDRADRPLEILAKVLARQPFEAAGGAFLRMPVEPLALAMGQLPTYLALEQVLWMQVNSFHASTSAKSSAFETTDPR
jgi:hypothetical protein